MQIKPSVIARNEPTMELFRSIQATYRALRARSDGYIESYDLTRPQFEVIAALGNTSGLTLKELSRRLPVTKGTLTGVLNRLEDRGLVRRMASDSDRRSTVASLTGEGEELYEEVFTGHVAYLKKFLAVLDDHDREALTRLMMRIQASAM